MPEISRRLRSPRRYPRKNATVHMHPGSVPESLLSGRSSLRRVYYSLCADGLGCSMILNGPLLTSNSGPLLSGNRLNAQPQNG
jgi:hypothetical protein